MGGMDNNIKKDEDQIEKLNNFEAKYAAYLKAKCFSQKDIYGDDIFEEKVVDGIAIRTSSHSGTKSYADPLAYWNEKFGHRVSSRTGD